MISVQAGGAILQPAGTADQWTKEGKNATKWTKLSVHDFVDNKVRSQLFVLAYNLGNFLRRTVLSESMRTWTMTTLREKLMTIGATVVHPARSVMFKMPEVAVPRKLFAAILRPDDVPGQSYLRDVR